MVISSIGVITFGEIVLAIISVLVLILVVVFILVLEVVIVGFVVFAGDILVSNLFFMLFFFLVDDRDTVGGIFHAKAREVHVSVDISFEKKLRIIILG